MSNVWQQREKGIVLIFNAKIRSYNSYINTNIRWHFSLSGKGKERTCDITCHLTVIYARFIWKNYCSNKQHFENCASPTYDFRILKVDLLPQDLRKYVCFFINIQSFPKKSMYNLNDRNFDIY